MGKKWMSGKQKKNKKKNGRLEADFMYVLGELARGGRWSVMALGWSETEQDAFHSETSFINNDGGKERMERARLSRNLHTSTLFTHKPDEMKLVWGWDLKKGSIYKHAREDQIQIHAKSLNDCIFVQSVKSDPRHQKSWGYPWILLTLLHIIWNHHIVITAILFLVNAIK